MKDNLKYMLKNWIAWDRKSLIYFFIRVPALVFQPIVTAYIPKAMIDCINEGVTVGRLILVVALLSVLVALTTWLAPFMQELLNGSARIIRMRYAVLAFRKNLNTDYTNIESLEGREKNKRAMEFYRSYYSSSADFLDTCNQLLVCIVGVITSLVLIYKINIIMILIILATCAAEFFLLKYLNKKEKGVKKARSSIFVKFDYYYSLSKDLTAAKDIRLYGFTDYFLFAVARLINGLEDITSKYMHQSIKVGGTRALLNLARELVAYAYLTYLVCQKRLSVSDFIFYFGIITGFSNWITNAVFQYSNIERCCNDCAAFREFIESNEESKSKPSVDFDDIESIEFKNVSFTYPSAENSTINDMSFKVNKGENIAIVGENGAGKTTAIKLLSDITEVPCKDGKLYVSPVLDCFNGEIVALEIRDNMKKELCVDTVKQLKYRYGNLNGVILHTDRGSQYTSDLFRSILSRYGIIQSLSSTGKCFDNSRMESFFATLKKEKLYQIPTYKMTKKEVKTIIYRYIFGYYNTIRVNSFNPGGWPPSVYRKMCEGEIAA